MLIAMSMIAFLMFCYFGRGEGTVADHDWEQEPQEGEGHRQHHQGKKEFLYPCGTVADHDWEQEPQKGSGYRQHHQGTGVSLSFWLSCKP